MRTSLYHSHPCEYVLLYKRLARRKVYMNIFIVAPHTLQTICALWALKKYNPATLGAELKFRSHTWALSELKSGDSVICSFHNDDTRLRVLQEKVPIYRTLEEVMLAFAPSEDRDAFEDLMLFLAKHKEHANGVRSFVRKDTPTQARIMNNTHLTAVFEALQLAQCKSNLDLFLSMSTILDGMLLRHKRNRITARDVQSATLTPCGMVAISKHAPCNRAHTKLFETKGVRAIVFIHGYDMGVLMHPEETLPPNHLAIAKILQNNGELDDWKLSFDGKTFSWGSDSKHACCNSLVKPEELAKTLSRLLENSKQE